MGTTLVLFTCDVECSLGNAGSREHPIFRPWSPDTWMWGRLPGSSQQWGVGRLMDQLDERGMKGTFYVSALERHFHGDEPVAEVARAIEERGHEAGVHVHCAWRGFGEDRRYDLDSGYHLRDSIGDHDEETQRELLGEAVDCLRRWTGVEPRSFRAGNYGATRTTLRILAELGLTSDSSANHAFGTLPELGTTNRAVEAEGLLQLPVTSFEAMTRPRRMVRFVDPSNMTVDEARRVFDQVAEMDIATLVLVTHSFQYVSPGHVPGERIAPARHVVDRVSRILDLLAGDPRFEPATMRDAAALPRDRTIRADGLPKNPAWLTALRLINSALDGVPRR